MATSGFDWRLRTRLTTPSRRCGLDVRVAAFLLFERVGQPVSVLGFDLRSQ
jgi:hypothetical protein